MPTSSKSPKPYSVHLDAATGRYYFLTDQNLLYACSFDDITSHLTPLVGIYDIEISEFAFMPQRRESRPHDERVSATVVKLLESHFKDESQVLIYMCDASDGRPAMRQALFTRWHRNMGDMFEHEPVQIKVRDAMIYGGILTRKDFPYQDTLQEQLRGKAAKLIAEKFSG